MGALNSKAQAPFLTYLTVFKSRLGAVNIVLPLAGFAYQPSVTLAKRLKERLSQMVPMSVADPIAPTVFEYLIEKKLVGAGNRQTGRYKDFSLLRREGGWQAVDRSGAPIPQVHVYQTDIWLADPAIESTIGVPTAENSGEILELCFQLELLSKSKSTWTAPGQLVNGLRGLSPDCSSNPMLLGLEVVPILRQTIARDGLLIRELLRQIYKELGPVSRDKVAMQLEAISERALSAAHSLKLPPPVLAEGKKFVALIRKTTSKREAASRAPGVLEHRSSPRLEWLTDFGVLEKRGPKNSFEYLITPDAALLLDLLDLDPNAPYWADDAALEFWRRSNHWKHLRARMSSTDLRDALRRGYRLMQRSVGPTAIREVCLAAGALAPQVGATLDEISATLVEWASSVQGITVSGGRYTRKPELVHITADVLGDA